MGNSAWSVWFHPLRTARIVDEQAAKLIEVLQQIDQLENTVYSLTTDKMTLEAEKAALESDKQNLGRRITGLEKSLATVKKQLSSAREEIRERKDAESQIREFEKTLEKVEEMKAAYEKRIHTLREHIKSLQAGHNDGYSASNELEEIDMFKPPRQNLQEGRTRKAFSVTRSEGPSDIDWLETLPE